MPLIDVGSKICYKSLKQVWYAMKRKYFAIIDIYAKVVPQHSVIFSWYGQTAKANNRSLLQIMNLFKCYKANMDIIPNL